METQVTPLSLNGCACRIKFDPRELQTLLTERLRHHLSRNRTLRNGGGALQVTGRLLEIDEGNQALHIMLAFIGKPKVICRVRVQHDGHTLVDDVFRSSPSGTCFHSMRALLNTAVNVLAMQVAQKAARQYKRTAKSLATAARA